MKKIISLILLFLIKNTNAHVGEGPAHNLTHPHHGSPLLWIFLASMIGAVIYKYMDSKK